MSKRIVVIHGPNLDRLGKREPHIYGTATLGDLQSELEAKFKGAAEFDFFQSNHEGAIIDKFSALADAKPDGVVINGGALTHTSVAIRDAISGCGVPTVEVHISNIHAREEFRKHSVTGAACVGLIAGLGFHGYTSAVEFLLQYNRRNPERLFHS